MNHKYPFLNPTLSLKERVQDLVSRLTLDEKSLLISTRNQAIERLGIPEFRFGAEGAHGYVDREGNNTTFPQTIGLAASWDRDLLGKVGYIASVEARVAYKARNCVGGLAVWSPTVDMERDPRWGRTEEGYGEDPFLAGELSSSYIRAAQGDHPFYLRVSCGPKHFFANNNEKARVNCSCSIPSRCMHEYYLEPFKKAIQDAKAVSMMTAYNEVNGIPMMLHPIQNDIVKKEWGIEGNIVTDGGDFLQTVKAHHYFETHAETLAAALKSGADSMTDSHEEVISAVLEAVEKKLINESELDEHLERILSIRFRFGQFDPPGSCPYDAIDEKDLMKEEYREIARDAVRKSIVLLKNDKLPKEVLPSEAMLPIYPDSVKGTIAVIGPLSDAVHIDWYSGHPTYIVTPLDGLRELYGKDKVVHADFRDIVSFTTEDGKPLVLADTGDSQRQPGSQVQPAKKLLSVGKSGETPARFYLEDWGWGAYTLTDVESGLLLESPYWRKEPGGSIENEQNIIAASGKNSLSWFGYSIFNLLPQENGLTIIQTFDNRRIVALAEGKVFLHDDPHPGIGELFKMKLEKEGLSGVVETAAKADQVIVICGNNPMINGRECTDRPSLNLPPAQEKLIDRIFAANNKTTLVLISGYPFTCKAIAEKIPAIIWMAPGIQETGNGLADVISGKYSPAGRLPLTWYDDESQLPSIMEYDIISAGMTYQYFDGNVLWSFGHGLCYSNFTYSDLKFDKTSVKENETIAVSFMLKNTGSITAEEVPQLYVTITGSAWERPIKTLKGFERIKLTAGEERQICFELPVKELTVWDSYRGSFFVETGKCKVSIGSSSEDIRLTGSFDILGETFSPRKITGPIYAERFDDYYECFLHEKRGSSIPAVFGRQDTGHLNYAQTHFTGTDYNISWIKFSSLDFGIGVFNFSAIVQGAPGSRIEIRLREPEGELSGSIEVPNTSEVSFYELNPTSPRRRPVWAYAETKLEKISGVHDVYLVLYGKTGIWRFEFKA